MGGSSSHAFPSYNWQFVSRPFSYDIEQDTKSGIHAEKHIIPNNPKISQREQMEVYRYRNLTNKPIVKVYGAEYIKSKAKGAGVGACGAAKDIAVHSEYIPFRLSDARNLTHGQSLYVLSEALAGFQQLHYRFGPFQITDNHIGFNEIGQCKVWHSPNFATNHLDLDSIILMSTKNPKNFDERMERRQQEEMVQDIWMAVDQHGNISPQFTQFANYFRERNFVEARTMVNNEIMKSQTYVPDHLNFGDNSVSRLQYGNNSPSIMSSPNQVRTTEDVQYHNVVNTMAQPYNNPPHTSTVNNYQAPYNNTQTSAYQNLGIQSTVSPYNQPNNTQMGTQFGNFPNQNNQSLAVNQNSGVVNYAH